MSHRGTMGRALTDVATPELEQLLSRLHKKQLVAPVTHQSLLHAGLPHLVDRVGFLSGLDEAAVRAVLVAVIAERRAAARAQSPDHGAQR